VADTTNAAPARANTPRDCYADKSHSAHDLLAAGARCQFCGFIAPTDAEVAALRSRCEVLALAATLNGETISGMQIYARMLEAERDGLATALRELLKQMSDEESNREEGVFVDAGCRFCTLGVTPDRYHTGPCARHRAVELLRKLGLRGAL